MLNKNYQNLASVDAIIPPTPPIRRDYEDLFETAVLVSTIQRVLNQHCGTQFETISLLRQLALTFCELHGAIDLQESCSNQHDFLQLQDNLIECRKSLSKMASEWTATSELTRAQKNALNDVFDKIAARLIPCMQHLRTTDPELNGTLLASKEMHLEVLLMSARAGEDMSLVPTTQHYML